MVGFEEKKSYFPKGLSQPEKGFRFAVDSLLLSCFAVPVKKARILDLGTGCGVIPIGLILKNHDKNLQLTGIENDPAMLESVLRNIDNMGLDNCFKVVEGSVSDKRIFQPESFDMVVSNPPFRTKGHGRECADAGKQSARFEEKGSLEDFVKMAAYAVKCRGRVDFVFLAERFLELLELMEKFRLTPKRIRFCHGRSADYAKIVLVEGIKNGKAGLCVEPPLILYKENSMSSEPAQAALEFCPFMAKKVTVPE